MPALADRGRRIRLVACDLDGTLLTSAKTLSPATLAVARELRARGIHLTIASGRIYTMLQVFSRALDIDVPLITSNGAIVIHPDTGETALDIRLDHEALERVIDFAWEHELDLSILAPELCLFSANSLRMRNFEQYNRDAAAADLPLMNLERLAPGIDAAAARARATQLAVSKLLVYQPGPTGLAALEAFVAADPDLLFVASGPELYEILPAGISKGRALAALTRHLGLEPDQVMAFGDFDNDLDMLEFAGFSVAMANSVPEVLAAADLVTASNDEDGVAAALRTYVL